MIFFKMLLSLLSYKSKRLPKFREIYIKKEAKIILWKITETEEELRSLLKKQSILTEIQKHRSELHRKQFIASRILLEQHNLLDCIRKDENGKPMIPEGHLSITHDSEYVALMISRNVCGIDLQSCTEKVFRVKHKFLDPTDFFPDQNELIGLTKVWSIKEAVYKIFGDPMVYFKEHMRLTGVDDKNISVDILHPDYKRSVTLEIRKIDDLFLSYTL